MIRADLYMTRSFYSIAIAQRFRSAVFVFGDNLERVGNGGQAIVRGEPNTVGVATKRTCGRFMTGTLEDVQAVVGDLQRVEGLMRAPISIIFPILDEEDTHTSLGCGLAELPIRAPALYGLIDDWFDRLPNKKEIKL